MGMFDKLEKIDFLFGNSADADVFGSVYNGV